MRWTCSKYKRSADQFYPYLVAAQMQEMQLVREKVYQMEQAHLAIKQK